MFWEGRERIARSKKKCCQERERVRRIFTESCGTTLPPKSTQSMPRSANCCRPHGTSTALHRPASGRSSSSSTIPLAPLVALAMAPSTLSAAQPLTRCGRARSRRCRSRPEVRCGITGEVGGAGEKLIRLGFEENIKRYVVRGGGSCGPLGGKEKGPLWQV
jgi:hypothetical protein